MLNDGGAGMMGGAGPHRPGTSVTPQGGPLHDGQYGIDEKYELDG